MCPYLSKMFLNNLLSGFYDSQGLCPVFENENVVIINFLCQNFSGALINVCCCKACFLVDPQKIRFFFLSFLTRSFYSNFFRHRFILTVCDFHYRKHLQTPHTLLWSVNVSTKLLYSKRARDNKFVL